MSNQVKQAAYPENSVVYVYKDHIEWDNTEKWFKLPSNLLNTLFLAEYLVPEDNFTLGLEWIKQRHPNSILIY